MKFIFIVLAIFLDTLMFSPSLRASDLTRELLPAKQFSFAKRNGIPYEVYRVSLEIPHALDEFNFTYSIEFPKLTQAQYELLMNHFGGTHKVPWSPDRRYDLLDFLPAKVQAFANRTLDQDYLPSDIPQEYGRPMRPPEEATESETGMNCWDAAYELLREGWNAPVVNEGSGRFFHLGAPIVDSTMKNPKFFDPKTTTALKANDLLKIEGGRAKRNRDRRVGDVLLIDTFANFGFGAAHAMVWIDDDFYFEKSDMGSTDPFRLVFYEDGIKFWLTALEIPKDSRKDIKGHFYRYDKPLPDPKTFAGKSFYYDWDSNQETAEEEGVPKMENLDEKIKQRFIWNVDVNLGGSLSKHRINPIETYSLDFDEHGRARFSAASLSSRIKIKNYGPSVPKSLGRNPRKDSNEKSSQEKDSGQGLGKGAGSCVQILGEIAPKH